MSVVLRVVLMSIMTVFGVVALIIYNESQHIKLNRPDILLSDAVDER